MRRQRRARRPAPSCQRPRRFVAGTTKSQLRFFWPRGIFPLFCLTRISTLAIARPLFHVSEHRHSALRWPNGLAGGQGDGVRWGRAETIVPEFEIAGRGDREGEEAMVSQASKRAWRRVAAGLFLLPALAEGGNHLYAQTPGNGLPAPAATSPADPAKEEAKLLLKQGRIYLQANDLTRARQYADLAQKKNIKWEFYEDSPEKLLADCTALTGNAAHPAATAAQPATTGQPAAPQSMGQPPVPA